MDLERLEKEVRFQAVRSRGPGGQNVNRVSSAAHMTWDFENSALLSLEEKARVRRNAKTHITKEGLIHFRADEFRDLERNKKRCLEKCAQAVARATFVPKKRKATKPTKASKIKRRESKSRRGEIKKLRGRVDY